MLELKEEVKGVATTYPLLTNGDLIKSQTVSDNTLTISEGIPTEEMRGNPNMTFIDEGNLYQVRSM